MAYEPKIAAALSGMTTGRLAYWRRTGILVPEVSSTKPYLYSFRDVMALRAFAILREKRPLQTIRVALQNLRDMHEADHLASYRLVVHGKKGIALQKGDEAVDLVTHPGQLIAVLEIGDVLKAFPFGDIEVPDLRAPKEHISIDPKVRGGHPVVAGTRVPFEVVASLVRDGVPPDAVRDFYPSVDAAAAEDALAFAEYVDRVATRRRAA